MGMKMSKEKRIKLIKQIQEKRGTKLITYITSDRSNLLGQIAGDAVSILHSHILAFKPDDRKKLDIFIYSRGGVSDAPWSIVSMFREYCREGALSVLIPYRAHSAATLIALGADEIVMTKKAELGPIDITLQSGPYNPKDDSSQQRLPISVEDVMGYFSLLEKLGCERPAEKMEGFKQLTSHIHPLAIGNVSRLLQQTELVALRLLGTRANPFPDEKNREIVKRFSSEIYSHLHTISRTEAKAHLGLEQVVDAEESAIDQELWELYNEYCELFNFEKPFLPEQYLIANDLDEYTWEDLGIASIESENKTDLFQKDIRVKRLRQVPPQVQIKIENVAFPSVHLPTLPSNVDTNQINQLVQQILPSIVQPVIERLAEDMKNSLVTSMPTAGFERLELNSGWRTIDQE